MSEIISLREKVAQAELATRSFGRPVENGVETPVRRFQIRLIGVVTRGALALMEASAIGLLTYCRYSHTAANGKCCENHTDVPYGYASGQQHPRQARWSRQRFQRAKT